MICAQGDFSSESMQSDYAVRTSSTAKRHPKVGILGGMHKPNRRPKCHAGDRAEVIDNWMQSLVLHYNPNHLRNP